LKPFEKTSVKVVKGNGGKAEGHRFLPRHEKVRGIDGPNERILGSVEAAEKRKAEEYMMSTVPIFQTKACWWRGRGKDQNWSVRREKKKKKRTTPSKVPGKSGGL